MNHRLQYRRKSLHKYLVHSWTKPQPTFFSHQTVVCSKLSIANMADAPAAATPKAKATKAKAPKAAPAHPPYVEMIKDAIASLKVRADAYIDPPELLHHNLQLWFLVNQKSIQYLRDSLLKLELLVESPLFPFPGEDRIQPEGHCQVPERQVPG